MPSPCFSLGCVVMETQPLAFSPPGIHRSRLHYLGKSRASHFPSISLAAPRAEPCHGPAWQLAVGCQGVWAVRNHQFLTLCVSLGRLGLLAGQEMLQHPRGKALPAPGNFLMRGVCSAQSAACLALGRGTAAMVSWGNRSVTAGRVAEGMETETHGFRVGVCLSKIGTSRVSALPRPNAVDVVTQLCLLPAPIVASCALPPATEGRQSRLLPGLLRCFWLLVVC